MSGTNSARLSPHAIFSLSQALNHLREAAEFTEQPLKDDINELADELEQFKEWSKDEH